MHKLLLVIILASISATVLSEPNTTSTPISKETQKQLDELNYKVKLIESNQVNYQIEKDLLQKTYRINYERINVVITIVLGIFGLLGYLGLKDIGSIKKDYEEELQALRDIQHEFKQKTKDIESEYTTVNSKLKDLFEENKIQNNKITFIELKEKAYRRFKNKEYGTALNYADAAISLQNDDSAIFTLRGRIYLIQDRYPEAKNDFEKAYEITQSIGDKLNLIESNILIGDIKDAEHLIEDDKSKIEAYKKGDIYTLFKLLIAAQKDDMSYLKDQANKYIESDENLANSNKKISWVLEDAYYCLSRLPDSDIKDTIFEVIWYLDGKTTGERLMSFINKPRTEN